MEMTFLLGGDLPVHRLGYGATRLCAQSGTHILGALMENSYLGSGHTAFFFLELFLVYEAGHFPCGWVGEWPHGALRVF
jgi:hypothetical protein